MCGAVAGGERWCGGCGTVAGGERWCGSVEGGVMGGVGGGDGERWRNVCVRGNRAAGGTEGLGLGWRC